MGWGECAVEMDTWNRGDIDYKNTKTQGTFSLVLFCYLYSFNSLRLRVRNVYPWKLEVGSTIHRATTCRDLHKGGICLEQMYLSWIAALCTLA